MAVKLYDYQDLVKSLSIDIKRNRKISFLIGSAMSYEKESRNGCPDVNTMLSIIKEYLIEVEMFDEEAAIILEGKGVEAYQKIYEFIFKTGGDQNDIKKLMGRFMSCAKDKQTGGWNLTIGVIEMAKYISLLGAKVDNILTTNFDPFIEEALNRHSINTVTHSLDYNSNINSVLNTNSGYINVVHLHGYYNTDTMHTQSQLESVRPKVKESIKSILSNSTSLYVFGYGGWDDIFISSLKDIVEEFDASYNIRWAFYSKSDGDILHENKKLLDIVEPAIGKGRFHPYKNVDCHKIFKDINQSVLDVGKFEGEINYIKKEVNKDVRPIAINEVFNPRSKTKDETFTLNLFDLPKDKAHDLIRIFEQSTALQCLSEQGGFVLESGWGYGKLGFLSSVVFSDDSERIVVRADLENSKTKIEAELKIIEDIGLDVSTLLALDLEKELIIILDNIDNADYSLLTYLNDISLLVEDSKNNVRVIFVTNKTLHLSFKTITLKQLDVDDIKEYMQGDIRSSNLQGSEIDKLYVLTSGMPVKLDKIQEYQKLGVMTLSDILEEEVIEVSPERLYENVPLHLLEQVDNLESSENLNNKRYFDLICIFSVLECGETAKNIKRHYYKYDFKIDDFHKLISLNLIKSIKKNEHGEIVILKINPLIKDYIRSKLNDEKVLNIIHNSMGLIYGEAWESILIKINPSVKAMHYYQDFFPGNAHLLTLQYLKYCLKKDSENLTKIIKLCIAYCMYLNNINRFKELVSFSESVYHVLSNHQTDDYCEILYYYAEGLRMIGNDALAVTLLKDPMSKDRSNVNTTNNIYYDLYATYLLALSSVDHAEYLNVASKILETVPTHYSLHYLARNSIISNSRNKKTKIQQLKLLEKQARRDGFSLVANNICLELVGLVSDGSDKYLMLVLDTEKSTYTRIRALIIHVRKLLNENPEKILVGGVLPSIVEAYRYLFLQRISLFNRCHDLLWDVFVKFGRFSDLYQVYRTSSILWRLNGEYSKEYRYAKDLIRFAENSSDYEIEYVNYLNKRFDYLNSNKDTLKLENN